MKNVIMLSGGIDSSALAIKLFSKRKNDEVYTGIYFDVGQTSSLRQEASVKRLSLLLDMPIEYVDIKGVSKMLLAKYEPPYYFVAEQVPADSCIVITMAGCYAVSIGASKLYHGTTLNDVQSSPNIRKMFDSIAETVKFNTGVKNFSIETPFIRLSESEIPSIINEEALKVNEIFTWSCYWGYLEHCGKCDGCKKRKKRFLKSKLKDETVYRKS